MSRPQRRKQFIDAHVQGALVRRLAFHWAVFLSVSFVVSFLLQVLSDPFRPLGEHLQNLWWTHGPFLLVVVFLLPVFIVDTIKISHRFAGPIFNLRRAMRSVASGEAPRPIKFRQNDFWQGLAGEYNALVRRFAPLSDETPIEADEEQPARAN
jgi:hypothetical protein